jgi:putative ABC transport system permease protein
MLRNYFKTAWRNIAANKLFAALNIAGLAIGLCVCITLFAYIAYELSFDRMYKNEKNIYRVNMRTNEQYNYKLWANLPNAVGPAMLQNISQVKNMTRLIRHDFGGTASLLTDNKTFVEKGLYMADPSVFSMFDFNFIEGNPYSAFTQPRSIVISESAKKRLYGKEPAFGKIICINSRDTLHVSGVYKDIPANSTIDCDMIYNIRDSWAGKNISWGNASFETYCLLQPGANIEEVQKQSTVLIEKNVPKERRFYNSFLLQPLRDIHLYSSDLEQGYSSKTGSIHTVKALLFLSLLVLAIACINYMNLATARSQKRAKSIGINKVLGADIPGLMILFYMETAVLSFIAVAIGYVLAFLLQPLFQDIIGIELTSSVLNSQPVLLSLLITWLLVTFIAGSYPAFSMSRISPLVLMHKLKLKQSPADFIRRTLVVFQFASSIVLIIGVIVIFQQIRYIRNKNLGYNPKGVVAVSIKSAQDQQQVATVINDLRNLANIESVSAVQSVPGDIESGRNISKSPTDKESYPVKTCHTNGDIVQTMHLKLLAGNTLPQSIAKDDTACYLLVNEAVIKYLGFKTPEEAIGRNINAQLDGTSVITGVVKNFNYQSLKNEIGGYIYYTTNNFAEPLHTLLVRYNSQNLSDFMEQVQGIFRKDLSNSAFEYQFLDAHVQNLYASEQHTANTVAVFSLLAIIIACLGLFGLAAFTAEQRIKGIGIRKVLGASATTITALISRDFLRLVLISILIASPVAWWLMHNWLNDFAYRINISWAVFVFAGIVALLIAFITVSSQSIKAAMSNPVKSLRTE